MRVKQRIPMNSAGDSGVMSAGVVSARGQDDWLIVRAFGSIGNLQRRRAGTPGSRRSRWQTAVDCAMTSQLAMNNAAMRRFRPNLKEQEPGPRGWQRS